MEYFIAVFNPENKLEFYQFDSYNEANDAYLSLNEKGFEATLIAGNEIENSEQLNIQPYNGTKH